MEKEVWKDIPGYEGRYQASSLGRIKGLPCVSRSKPRILKLNLKPSGYLNVLLCKNGKVKTWRVNRLIAMTFIKNPYGKEQVNHINGIKVDNRASNLEWATASENIAHAYQVLGRKSNGGVARKKIKCVETGKEYPSLADAARGIGRARQALTYCMHHKGKCGGFHWEYAN